MHMHSAAAASAPQRQEHQQAAQSPPVRMACAVVDPGLPAATGEHGSAQHSSTAEAAANGGSLHQVQQEARWHAHRVPQLSSPQQQSSPQDRRQRDICKLRRAIKTLSNKMEFDKWQQRLACSPLQRVWLEAKQQALQSHSRGPTTSDKGGVGQHNPLQQIWLEAMQQATQPLQT